MPIPCCSTPWLRLLAVAALLIAGIPVALSADWLPLAADELAMTSEPKAPRAPAVYLYRQVDRDDESSHEESYSRIKILTEEGRKYADVELTYLEGRQSISGIEARTIHPDGRVIPFNGTIYEKPLLKARGVRYMAKTFTLPDVQVGSIIEYRYRRRLDYGLVYDSKWILSEELFTRKADFSLVPNRFFTLRWIWPIGLPEGTETPALTRGKVRLTTRDVPAFTNEPYMPPEDALKFRVEFIYQEGAPERDAETYWKNYRKREVAHFNSFINETRAMERAVASIVAPSDPPRVKAQKLYTRVQSLRNLSFEKERSEQEADRENLKSIHDVSDALSRGYGSSAALTFLYIALARAAGIEADGVEVATRSERFFNAVNANGADLDGIVARLRIDGTDLYAAPGVPFIPLGVLPWDETGVAAMALVKDGPMWMTLPVPPASDARTERDATMELSDGGSLEGTVRVTFVGLDAAELRRRERHSDLAARTKLLEGEVKDVIPVGSEVELTNSPDWASSTDPLVAEYTVRVPGWATAAGSRLLLPTALFGAAEKPTFTATFRKYPMYFSHPHLVKDAVSIALPAGMSVGTMPKPVQSDINAFRFSSDAVQSEGKLRLQREIALNAIIIQSKHYDLVRDFFQTVRATDDEQIILARPAKKSAP